jgi:hypothetical protein
MVNFLLSQNVDLNSRAPDGTTPFVLAVAQNREQVVRALMKEKGLAMQDSNGTHIFFIAVEAGHWDMAKLLAPQNTAEALPSDIVKACKEFRVSGVDCFPGFVERLQSSTVYDMLHGDTTVLSSMASQRSQLLRFRWIHLPANNPDWIEAIIIKLCMETMGHEGDSLKNLVSSMKHCHRGQYPHSRYHQPGCQTHGRCLWFSMPYLNYETASDFQEMQATIQRVLTSTASDAPMDYLSGDDLLIKAYMTPGGGDGLHIRRILDEFLYPDFDATLRDRDQVVYRYQKSTGIGMDDPKLYMVDQPWIVIVKGDLIITSFPERRNLRMHRGGYHAPDDRLDIVKNLYDYFVRSETCDMHELIVQVTNRCCGMFDRYVPFSEEYEFLSMFEASIRMVAGREAELSAELWSASAEASSWLKSHEQGSREQSPEFLDKFLDFGPETRLLAEAKDIRDELNMLSAVLNLSSWHWAN